MARYAVRKQKENTGIWEWHTIKDPNSTYVEIQFYESRQDAEEKASTWGANAEVVEIK